MIPRIIYSRKNPFQFIPPVPPPPPPTRLERGPLMVRPIPFPKETGRVYFMGPPSRVEVVQYDQTFRALYRVEDTTIDEFRVWIKVGSPPDPDVDPVTATTNTLPYITPALAPGVNYILVRRVNEYDVESFNVYGDDLPQWSFQVVVDGAGNAEPFAPSAPQNLLALQVGDNIRLTGTYQYQPDGISQADTWAIWYTVNGAAPDPDVDPVDVTLSMNKTGGFAPLDTLIGTFSDTDDVKIVVRTRRTGAPDVDSTNTDVLNVIMDVSPPDAPSDAAHLGHNERQE